MPARDKWWDEVVSNDIAAYYKTAANAQADTGVKPNGEPKSPPATGRQGSFIWGDRVRVLAQQGDARLVGGRGVERWVHKRNLGGQPLLEIYFIDVGQGDGALIVTPAGEHVMIDGGNVRSNQNGGRNAADYVDWKFFKDYLDAADRTNPQKTRIRLDAMIATHNDIDHFGGLLDLIDQTPQARVELDSTGVTTEAIYHAGLSWWFDGLTPQSDRKRTLGPAPQGLYTKLIGDRPSCAAATANIANPDLNTLDGAWGSFVAAAVGMKRKDGTDCPIERLSNLTHGFLPGFAPQPGGVAIRVLGPIETLSNGKPALKKFPDGDSKNTNGHSVVLRIDYGDRRIVMTGDLNWHSQKHIMATYGTGFVPEFACDVTKGCHHGSNDVSLTFLEGLRPLCTVISSGDAETHDHPRPNIVAASGITARRLVDHENDRLIAPLVYMTEVARSVKVTRQAALGEWTQAQPEFSPTKPTGAKDIYKTAAEQSRFRVFLGTRPAAPTDWPRFDDVIFVDGLRYGLVNVRTDGKRLFFAVMEETGSGWAVVTLSEDEIVRAH